MKIIKEGTLVRRIRYGKPSGSVGVVTSKKNFISAKTQYKVSFLEFGFHEHTFYEQTLGVVQSEAFTEESLNETIQNFTRQCVIDSDNTDKHEKLRNNFEGGHAFVTFPNFKKPSAIYYDIQEETGKLNIIFCDMYIDGEIHIYTRP